MNAVDILKQSFHFYKNLFSELTTLGLYIYGAVFIDELMQYIGLANPLTGFFAFLLVFFSPVFIVLYVHQFASGGGREFGLVWPSFKTKLWPFIKTILLLALFALLIFIPVGFMISLFSGNKVLGLLLALVCGVFVIWACYRISMVMNVVLLSEQSGLAAIQRSSDLAKDNPFMVSALLTYVVLFAVFGLPEFITAYLWGMDSFQTATYQCLIGVFLTPFGTVFLYRVYTLVNEERPLEAMTLDFAAQPQNAAENQLEQAPEGQEVTEANNPDVNAADTQSAENHAADNNKPEPK
ncbi:MAG: hypothetical protein H7A09_11600 [Oceanospirillaceae bacterium]|nr:hypothetical protein [Oceanospirillaceae bacterium]MCP5350893.1 hypothetical protein [Oceanospirillaceae bacterium]